jgi:His/Glu/Gln/Arg/opine family amino acid ABC transporter permease subunit
VNFVQILLTLLRGAGYTLLITLACGTTAFVAGLATAVARELGPRWLAAVLSALVYVFRGVPMLVLLFVVFFGLPGIGLDVPPLLAMMLSLGLISGAYLSEVFRGALAAVNPNEVLAAEAMGFTRFETLRLIKIPQMMRFSVPGMVNELGEIHHLLARLGDRDARESDVGLLADDRAEHALPVVVGDVHRAAARFAVAVEQVVIEALGLAVLLEQVGRRGRSHGDFDHLGRGGPGRLLSATAERNHCKPERE